MNTSAKQAVVPAEDAPGAAIIPGTGLTGVQLAAAIQLLNLLSGHDFGSFPVPGFGGYETAGFSWHGFVGDDEIALQAGSQLTAETPGLAIQVRGKGENAAAWATVTFTTTAG